MSANLGPDVKKFVPATAQQTLNGTEEFVHPGGGARNFASAIRFHIGQNSDKLRIRIRQRIPGRNSDVNADDYYDDESLSEFTLGGLTSGAVFKFEEGGNYQHIQIVGSYYNASCEYVVDYLWQADAGGIHANSRVMAQTTWTQPA